MPGKLHSSELQLSSRLFQPLVAAERTSHTHTHLRLQTLGPFKSGREWKSWLAESPALVMPSVGLLKTLRINSDPRPVHLRLKTRTLRRREDKTRPNWRSGSGNQAAAALVETRACQERGAFRWQDWGLKAIRFHRPFRYQGLFLPGPTRHRMCTEDAQHSYEILMRPCPTSPVSLQSARREDRRLSSRQLRACLSNRPDLMIFSTQRTAARTPTRSWQSEMILLMRKRPLIPMKRLSRAVTLMPLTIIPFLRRASHCSRSFLNH